MVADVGVIGAGLAGLLCAQALRQMGYEVVVLEKSRGLGGRLATRRLQNSCADHGVRCLEQQGELTQALIEILSDRAAIQLWRKPVYKLQGKEARPEPWSHVRYISDPGMTAIAKVLGTGLTIHRSQRAIALEPKSQHWQITTEDSEGTLTSTLAKILVLAIPAPQAWALLAPLKASGIALDLLASVQTVQFDPCITAIATYAPDMLLEMETLPWGAVDCTGHPSLAWVSCESSKRSPTPAVWVVQSNATFAHTFLEVTDLQPVGQRLLNQAAELFFPALQSPVQLQVHRWRYAFPTNPRSDRLLWSPMPLPLLCCGDWCGGQGVETALRSGWETAWKIARLHHLNPQIPQDRADGMRSLLGSGGMD